MDSGYRQISFPLILGDPTWEQSLGMLPSMVGNREAKGGLSTGGKSSADVNEGQNRKMQRPHRKWPLLPILPEIRLHYLQVRYPIFL